MTRWSRCTTAAPGNPWWEIELWRALMGRDVARVKWLVDLAEAEELAGGIGVLAPVAVGR